MLPLLLAGCFHMPHHAQNAPAPPPIELPVPPTPAKPAPAETTPPATTPAQEPALETKPPEEEDAQPPVHHKKHPAKPVQDAVQEPPAAPAGVSAIGQLSSGDSGDLRQQTEDLIQSTERGLKAITRQLNSQEQKTAAQITEFLKQARSALGSGDVDGAHTLALKAKVLLSELSQ
ncbi:MAG: hypothetical protein KGM96_12795 [Acidobacteriota bacterium]|nr:hypothetical protein [Acidobacteriota bacterium]